MVIWPNYCDYLHNCHQNGYRTGPPKECSYTADNYSPQTKLIPCSTNMLKRMCRPSFLPLEYLTKREKKTKSIFSVIWHIDSNGFRFQKVRFMTYIKSPENTPISLTDFASKLDPKSNSGKNVGGHLSNQATYRQSINAKMIVSQSAFICHIAV